MKAPKDGHGLKMEKNQGSQIAVAWPNKFSATHVVPAPWKSMPGNARNS